MQRTWIKNLFAKPTRPATRFAPRLDLLEGRDVPATFYVDPAGTNVFNAGRADEFTGVLGVDVFADLDGAVAAANAAAGPDIIRLAHTGSFINISSPTNTPLAITQSVDIIGDGASASVLTTVNNQSDAVLLVSGAGVVANLSNLSFFGNAAVFDGAGNVDAGGGQTGTAIRYTAGTTGTINNTVWQGIFADGFLGVAIEAAGTNTALTVQNSQFSSIGRVGVLAGSSAAVSLFSNTYVGKGGVFAIDYFAQISDGASAVISGNTVSGNQGVAGGDSAAVLVSQVGGAAATANIFGNTFTGNINGIIVGDNAADTSSVTASYNNIFGNFNGIGTNRNPAPGVNAANVWWGTPTGPFNATNNAAGTGNDVADDVLFAPLRTAAVPVLAAPTLPQYLAAAFPQTVTVAVVNNAAEPATNGLFRFTRTGDTSIAVTVNYTVGGTAVAGTDYAALSGTVNFAAGQATVDVPVNVIDNAVLDGTRTVIVTPTAAAGVTVGPAATMNITDNETPPVVPTVSVTVVNNAAEPSTNGLFRFTRTDTSAALAVNYTVGGTAVAGTDYAALSGTVNFAVGQATVDVPVNVIDDVAVDGTKTVIVTITPAAGITVGGTPATMNITDNDPVVVVPPPTLIGAKEFGAGADLGGAPQATLYNPDGSVRFTQSVFAANFAGGVRTAAADFNNDGIADLVVGTGPGIATQVRILSGANGVQLFSVAPFEAAFTGGVYVAAGDINGDGVAELVITPDQGGGPRVQVYNGIGFGKIADFLGINDNNFRGGARPSVGDINGDGKSELVISAGFSGGPRVSTYNGASIGNGPPVNLFGDFFIFEQALRNGAFVSVGDVNGDGLADIVGGGGPGGGPRVLALSGVDLLAGKNIGSAALINFFAGDVSNRGGIRVAMKNLDGDAQSDLVVGDGTGAGSRVTGYLGKNFAGGVAPATLNLTAFPGFNGGVFVG